MCKKVIDLNGKERKVVSLKKIIHEVRDVVNDEPIEQVFLEVEIIGKHNNWIEWWNYKDFLKLNPNRKPRWKK